MDESDFLKVLQPYLEAFVEADPTRRLELLAEAMSPEAEICGPKRVFAGYQEISEKIASFHANWPDCRLVLMTGLNIFSNSALFGGGIVGPDDAAVASGHSVVELAEDGRIQRVIAFWGALPSLPARWPKHLASPSLG